MKLWKDYKYYSDDNATYWRSYNKNNHKISKVIIEKEKRSFSVTSSLLYAEPNSNEFLNLTSYKEIVSEQYSRNKKKYLFSFAVLVFMNLAFAISNYFYTINNAINIQILLLFSAFMVGANGYSFSTYQKYKERAEFFNYTYTDFFNKNIVIIFIIILSVGFHYICGFDTQIAFAKFGMRPDMFFEGEYWRSLTAPIIHTGLSHAIINYFMLLTLFPLISWISLKMSLMVVISTAILGHVIYAIVSQFQVLDSDLSVGISGAVSGIIGAMLYFSLKAKFYPKHWIIVPLTLVILFLVITPILNERASSIIHISGFLLGIIIPIFFKK